MGVLNMDKKKYLAKKKHCIPEPKVPKGPGGK